MSEELQEVYYQGIKLDLSRDELFSVQGKELMAKYYTDGKSGVQKAIAKAANTFSYGDKVLAQEIYDAASQHWFFYSSPILSNAVEGHWDESVDYKSKEFWAIENTELRKKAWIGEKPKAMPIACFLTFLGDSIESQLAASEEISRLSVTGGGTSLHNNIRAVSDKAPGPIPYYKTVDGNMGYYRQGKTRRGSCAIYMDVSHPDIVEFIGMRKTSGGDPARKINNRAGVHNAVNITRKFKDAVLVDGEWDLICPHTGEIKETIRARYLWELMLETRELTGEPYLYFIDVSNDALPESQKKLGLKNHGSNLCFSGETLVRVGDFPVPFVTIKELAEYSNGSAEFNVLSADWKLATNWNEELQKAVAFKTGTRKLIKLTLSDGSSFKCTPNHELAVSVCGYISAECSLNVPLVPHNTKELHVVKIEDAGIEDVYDLTVEKNENFYIITNETSESGILVHNCSEITLPTDESRSAVCALSSVNLEYYETWKNTKLVPNLVRFIDNVIQWYIDWASDKVHRTKYSAMRERAIGIGAMGWHNFLMSKDIPFESGGFNSASQWNNIIFADMKNKAIAESLILGDERGEAPDMIGTGRRNSATLALAPNSNSSVLCNTSSAMEPIASNGYAQKTRAGIFLMKNKFLERKLEELGKNDAETWKTITDSNGSVQHLDFLSEHDKEVFKTAWEIDQHWIVQHAGDRQQYICQAQSCNLFFMPGSDKAYINSVHMKAMREEKIKSLYYFRTGAASSADTIKEISRKSLADWKEEVKEDGSTTCSSCEG